MPAYNPNLFSTERMRAALMTQAVEAVVGPRPNGSQQTCAPPIQGYTQLPAYGKQGYPYNDQELADIIAADPPPAGAPRTITGQLDAIDSACNTRTSNQSTRQNYGTYVGPPRSYTNTGRAAEVREEPRGLDIHELGQAAQASRAPSPHDIPRASVMEKIMPNLFTGVSPRTSSLADVEPGRTAASPPMLPPPGPAQSHQAQQAQEAGQPPQAGGVRGTNFHPYWTEEGEGPAPTGINTESQGVIGKGLTQVPVQLAGCNLTSSGEDIWFHRQTYQSRPNPGEEFVGIGSGKDAMAVVYNGTLPGNTKLTQEIAAPYSQNLYRTPIDQAEQKVATGIMTNAWTGETFETFENLPPPPDGDYSIPVEQFEKTNPYLVYLQGGYDLNRRQRSKQEICNDMPLPNGGPTPEFMEQRMWDNVRERLEENVLKEVWLNRDGLYAQEPSMNGEKPAGFVGKQPAYRFIPYLPPTETLKEHDWVGPVDYDTGPIVPGEVFFHGNELTQGYTGIADPGETDTGDYIPHEYTRNSSQRGVQDTTGITVGHAEYEGIGNYIVGDTELRPSQGDLMMKSMPLGNANDESLGNYIVGDTELRPSQGDLMMKSFPTANANNEDAGNYIVGDTELRPSQGDLMMKSFPTANANDEGAGNYIVGDTELRPSQGDLMMKSFPTANANDEGAGNYIVGDTELRPSQGDLMMKSFPTSNANDENAGNYIVGDTELRPSQGDLMMKSFPTANANDESAGNYIVGDTELRPSQGDLMMKSFPTANANDENAGNYIVADTELRPTQKDLMMKSFPVSGANEESLGAQLPFQGKPLETNRSWHEENTYGAGPIDLADGVGAGPVESREGARQTQRDCDINFYDVITGPNLDGPWDLPIVNLANREDEKQIFAYERQPDLAINWPTTRNIPKLTSRCADDYE